MGPSWKGSIKTYVFSAYTGPDDTGTPELPMLLDPNQQGMPNNNPRQPCTFPEWATSIGTLHSFSFTSQYEFTADGRHLLASNYSYIGRESHLISRTTCVRIVDSRNGTVESEEDEEITEEEVYVKLVTKVTAEW